MSEPTSGSRGDSKKSQETSDMQATGVGSSPQSRVEEELRQARNSLEECTAELANSLSLFNATLEATADGVLAVSLDGRIICANAKFARMWSVPADLLARGSDTELRTFAISQVANPEAFDRRNSELHARPVAEALDLIEMKDGRILERHLKPQIIDGRCVGMVMNFRDVTEARRVEKEVKEQAAGMAAAQKIAHFGSWEIEFSPMGDPDNSRLRWSDEMFRIAGFEPGSVEVTNELFFSLVPTEDHRAIRDAMTIALSGNGIYSVVHRMVRPDGTERIIRETAQPFFDERSGRPLKVIGSAHDITERKRAEDAQRESEERFRLLATVTNDAIWDWDIVQDRLWWNEGFEDLFGFSRSEIEPTVASWTRRIHPDDQNRVARDLEASMSSGAILWSDEYRFQRKSGGYAHVMDRGRVIRNSDGKAVRMIGGMTDVTERRHSEEKLRESERRYFGLFEHSPIPIWVEDFSAVKQRLDELRAAGVSDFAAHFRAYPETVRELAARIRIIDINAAVLRLHKATSKEQLFADLALVFTDESYKSLADEFTWIASGKLSFDLEEDVRTLDGEIRRVVVRLTVAPGYEQNLERVLVSVIDVTERRKAGERIAEQAALLDQATDAILVFDLGGRITYWNRSAERLYGWTTTEAFGRSAEQLIYRDSDAFTAAMEKTLAKGEWVGAIQQVTKDGRHLDIEGRWSLVRDAQGRPKSVLSINTDVTERRKLEQQFLRAQRMESIGTLAGGIAHDLNNVLAPILMSLELLKLKFKDKEDEELLQTLLSSAQRGAELVRQVLTFARGVEGQRVTVNLVHLLRDAEKIIRDTFPKSVDFKFAKEGEVWNVTGDPTQLHQVFLNLCVNARDAMPNGGKLAATLENSVLDEVYVGMNPDSKVGAYVVLKVTDNGSGIPDRIRDRIFEPFFTTKELGKGTGLGLSTTLAIVKSHGGFINLYSEAGKGTTFKVYLPANTSITAAEETAVEKTGLPRGNGETILVVDDEEGIRSVAKRTLERFGYRVLLAAHGAEAVALYAQRKGEIAVVLTDMAMPVMDGPALIIALKTLDPNVRIIASSGLNANGGVAKALGAGVEHFVPKPYTAEAILRMISQILAK